MKISETPTDELRQNKTTKAVQRKWILQTTWHKPTKESFIDESGFTAYRDAVWGDYQPVGFFQEWKEASCGLWEKAEWRDLPEVKNEEFT